MGFKWKNGKEGFAGKELIGTVRNAGERSVGKSALETVGRGFATASNKY